MVGKKRYDHITVIPEVFLEFRALRELSLEGKSDSRFVKELLRVYRTVHPNMRNMVLSSEDYAELNAKRGQEEMEASK